MIKALSTAAIAALAMASAAASATPVSFTYTANGVTDSVSQQATAVFTFDTSNLSSFTLTLTDNVNPTAFIQSELTGLLFSFSSAPSSIALVSVNATSVIDCTNTSSPCPSGAGSSPYGWGATLAGGDLLLGAGFDGSAFSYQPYGIVNANYTSSGGGGGLGVPTNNPLLVGPVTFGFTVSGLAHVPMLNDVRLAFGDPDIQVTVPEPQSLALLGGAFLALWLTRRQGRRSVG